MGEGYVGGRVLMHRLNARPSRTCSLNERALGGSPWKRA